MFKTLLTLESEEYYCPNETSGMGVAPTGNYVAVGSKNGKLVIFDMIKGEVEEIMDREHTCAIVSVEWSSRGTLATIDQIGNLFIWE